MCKLSFSLYLTVPTMPQLNQINVFCESIACQILSLYCRLHSHQYETTLVLVFWRKRRKKQEKGPFGLLCLKVLSKRPPFLTKNRTHMCTTFVQFRTNSYFFRSNTLLKNHFCAFLFATKNHRCHALQRGVRGVSFQLSVMMFEGGRIRLCVHSLSIINA